MKRIAVMLDQNLVSAAIEAAAKESRSTAQQIEYWAALGKSSLENPDLPVSFIAEAILSLSSDHAEASKFEPRKFDK